MTNGLYDFCKYFHFSVQSSMLISCCNVNFLLQCSVFFLDKCIEIWLQIDLIWSLGLSANYNVYKQQMGRRIWIVLPYQWCTENFVNIWNFWMSNENIGHGRSETNCWDKTASSVVCVSRVKKKKKRHKNHMKKSTERNWIEYRALDLVSI